MLGNIKNFNMANGHGGKREGAKRPELPFKTKEIRVRIKADAYYKRAKKGETYDQFFERNERAALEAIQKEQLNN